MFFNFYGINLLRDFKNRDGMIYYSSKSNRIDIIAELVTDEFYNEIYQALFYSCIRESRHFPSEMDYECTMFDDKKYFYFASDIRSLVKTEENYKRQYIPFCEVLAKYGVTIYDIHTMFSSGLWHSDYGGKLWADACFMLLQLPKTHRDKVIWIDRVLDLYHNNGPLLDKTEFSILFSDDWECIGNDGNYYSALDFRAKASLKELKDQCSSKVKNIIVANARIFPEALTIN